MYKILSVNPGSTSTKFAVYEGERLICLHTIRHSTEELLPYKSLTEQSDFRKKVILNRLKEDGIRLSELSAVVGRGGLVKPMESGVYEVNDRLIYDLKYNTVGEHASNLGGIIAHEIAEGIQHCRAFIADPVVVDELQDVARISGIPQFPRRSQFHALNHKAVGRKYAKLHGTSYEKLNLIVAHLGGGISVGAHRQGKVIDVNQGLDGYGPFSPERAGTVDAGQMVKLCFSGKYTEQEIRKMIVGNGGLMAHLGTNEVQKIAVMAETNEYARTILQAMAYQVGKEIGSMFAVMRGDVDAVILTGGIAHSQFVVDYIRRMISSFARVVIYPGEDEMEALAMSGLRVLNGETAKEY